MIDDSYQNRNRIRDGKQLRIKRMNYLIFASTSIISKFNVKQQDTNIQKTVAYKLDDRQNAQLKKIGKCSERFDKKKRSDNKYIVFPFLTRK